ncbi:SAM-dependent methyltransferase [Pueribacillus theae]|uniref:SAM-dependent methyltransferase n=1 Tax=Pueribacillus theae TaxID=2171751 RepID=A0A2U1JX10_9BACI|nr:rRNA adenine N-6-methyltransferase family protein [Pueribacillus theae]PWA09750.1 SAM-dependent methyltransferase [Pueribacillus theae]
MKSFTFLFQYFLKPRTVGAILPSSSKLAEKMMDCIDFQTAKCILEYGPGTGVFTDKMLEKRNEHTVVVLIEYNKEFCKILNDKFKDKKNVMIINGSAEDIDSYVNQYNLPRVDYIVSGLPFASLPENVSHTILLKTKKLLGDSGKFITFQYTQFKKGLISQYFRKIDIKWEYRNIPPAYVFCCSNA